MGAAKLADELGCSVAEARTAQVRRRRRRRRPAAARCAGVSPWRAATAQLRAAMARAGSRARQRAAGVARAPARPGLTPACPFPPRASLHFRTSSSLPVQPSSQPRLLPATHPPSCDPPGPLCEQEKFRASLPGIEAWQARVVAECRRLGYVEVGGLAGWRGRSMLHLEEKGRGIPHLTCTAYTAYVPPGLPSYTPTASQPHRPGPCPLPSPSLALLPDAGRAPPLPAQHQLPRRQEAGGGGAAGQEHRVPGAAAAAAAAVLRARAVCACAVCVCVWCVCAVCVRCVCARCVHVWWQCAGAGKRGEPTCTSSGAWCSHRPYGRLPPASRAVPTRLPPCLVLPSCLLPPSGADPCFLRPAAALCCPTAHLCRALQLTWPRPPWLPSTRGWRHGWHLGVAATAAAAAGPAAAPRRASCCRFTTSFC